MIQHLLGSQGQEGDYYQWGPQVELPNREYVGGGEKIIFCNYSACFWGCSPNWSLRVARALGCFLAAPLGKLTNFTHEWQLCCSFLFWSMRTFKEFATSDVLNCWILGTKFVYCTKEKGKFTFLICLIKIALYFSNNWNTFTASNLNLQISPV